MEWKAEEISKLLANTVFRFSDERTLQAGIEVLFEQKGVPYEREVILSPKDRVDFMSGQIAIEVKVDSSPTTVQRQLWRYAADERIESILLVTSRMKHRSMPGEILGKPLHVVWLVASIF